MKWEDKIQMVKLLNNNKYKEATEFFIQHEDWDNWNDLQALDMYITDIDLTYAEECRQLEEKLNHIQTNYSKLFDKLSFRSALRVGMLQVEWEDNAILSS